MKHTIAILGLLFGLVSVACGATYSVESVLTGGTNNVSAESTNTYTTALDVRKQDSVALDVVFKGTGTNASSITLTFLKSVDGSTWDTSGSAALSWVVVANGTNTVTTSTNMTTGGYGWLKLYTVANPNSASALTNLAVRYAIKRIGE